MAESESGKIELPSEEEIAKLPRLAQVAFAARCARRAQPQFKELWPDAPGEHLNAVDAAVTLAEAVGAATSVTAAAAVVVTAAAAAADAASAAANVADIDAAVADAAGAAAYAAYAATNANAAAANAAAAARAANGAAIARAAYAATRRDHELLKAVAGHEKWTDETPVPPEFFGPLWPDGEPEDWPEDEGRAPKPFELVIDPGDADTATIQEVMSALSDLHEVHTGYGLTYRVDGALIRAEVEVLT